MSFLEARYYGNGKAEELEVEPDDIIPIFARLESGELVDITPYV